MHEKDLWFALVVLVFLAPGICAAVVPGLLGKWTGSWNSYAAEDGYCKLSENMRISIIVEQKDRLFAGNITYIQNEEEIVEVLPEQSGLDNKTLYIAEFDEGYDMGTII